MQSRRRGQDARPYGAHFCSIQEEPDQQFPILAKFFAEGLDRGEQCIYGVFRNDPKAVAQALAMHGLEIERHLVHGSLQILDCNRCYCERGRFNPEAALARLREAIESCRVQGYRGLRIAGEISGAFGIGATSEQVLAYEESLSEIAASQPIASLCIYNVDHCDPSIMGRVHAVHTDCFFWGRPPDKPFIPSP